MTAPLAPDTTIAERYLLEERIAIGGMGEVWRARDVLLSRTVAVKVLKAEYVADPSFLARFRNEAKHTAALSHPGIAKTFDYGEVTTANGQMAYLVMELVNGEPLSAVLAREGRLPVDRTLDIVGQTGLALQAAHDSGVVHRDVKPANLLIRPDGVVKVTDFGISRAVNAAPVTQTGFVVGTAAYLSPEQAAGKPVTPASDVYALGVVAYECLSGHRPFDDGSPVAIAMAHINNTPAPLPKDLPPLVVDFVVRALDKDPQRRQPSAGDFGRTALALAATLREAEPAATAQPVSHPQTKVLTSLVDAPATAAAPTSAAASATAAGRAGDDRERRRIRNIFIAIGTLTVLLGFLLLRSCGSSTPKPPAPATPAPRATPTVATVTVRAADYLGRPVGVARSALTADGLQVQVSSVPTTSPAGSVVGVSPTGTVRRGSTVTLTVATPPPAPVKHHGKHGHGGKGGD